MGRPAGPGVLTSRSPFTEEQFANTPAQWRAEICLPPAYLAVI